MDSVQMPGTSTTTWTPAFAGVTITASLPRCPAPMENSLTC